MEAVLQSRTSFATGILKLELICQSFGMDTKVGERVGDRYVFNFKSVAKNSEGGGTGGGTDPFEVPDEGGALARIEAKLEQIELKVEEPPPGRRRSGTPTREGSEGGTPFQGYGSSEEGQEDSIPFYSLLQAPHLPAVTSPTIV